MLLPAAQIGGAELLQNRLARHSGKSRRRKELLALRILIESESTEGGAARSSQHDCSARSTSNIYIYSNSSKNHDIYCTSRNGTRRLARILLYATPFLRCRVDLLNTFIPFTIRSNFTARLLHSLARQIRLKFDRHRRTVWCVCVCLFFLF